MGVAPTFTSISLTVVFSNYLILLLNGQDDSVIKSIADDFWQWQVSHFPSQVNANSENVEEFTLETFERRMRDCQNFLSRLDDVKTVNLSRADLMTAKLLSHQLTTFIDGYRWRDYGAINPVNDFETLHLASLDWVRRFHCNTADDHRLYVRKLAKVPKQINEIRDLLKRAVMLNRTNHRTSMQHSGSRIEEYVRGPPEDSVYYVMCMTSTLDNVGDMSESDKQELRRKAAVNVVAIIDAYRLLAEYISTTYLNATRPFAGVWCWMDGYLYYEQLLKWYLSADVNPETLHTVGKQEVGRIKSKMQKVVRSLGYSEDIRTFFKRIQNSSFYNHTPEEYLDLYRNAIYRRIQPRLFQLFLDISQIPNVTILGDETEDIMASYGGGAVIISTKDVQTRLNFTVMAMALHEGSPGHHLMSHYLNAAEENKLPNFRKYIASPRKNPAPFHFPPYSSYVEGWGLYSEFLGEEMNLFTDPYELLGRYDFERFRACRLVVDTGIHMKGWSQEQAIKYLKDNTILSDRDIEVEIVRYVTFPGQACAYKFGEMKIIELRRKAESTLGSVFNIRKFHDVVLRTGAIPLGLLEEVVDDWINHELTTTNSGQSHVPHDIQLLIVLYFIILLNLSCLSNASPLLLSL